MRIFVEYDKSNTSGKGKFLTRLCREWDRQGIAYSHSAKGCDVRLAVIKFRTETDLPTVLRVDGSHNEHHMDEAKQRWKNKLLAGYIRRSKAVIWQSEFCRKMGHVVFDERPRKEFVIFNGADPADWLPRTPKKEVVMSAYWKERPHKRLKEMTKIAVEYVKTHPEVTFHVLGEPNYVVNNLNIVYHGHLTTEQMKEIFATAGCMLNICYADWCPNAVVEALVAGVPVICTKGHGVTEIVRESGIVVDIDDPIDKKHFYRAMNKPIKTVEPVYNALDIALSGKVDFPQASHLYIEKIAKEYYEVLRGCC